MKRPLVIMLAVCVLSGCNLQGPPGTDPFFGPTRVPAPGTGSISAGTADPYYSGVPYSAAPSSALPSMAAPQSSPATGVQSSGPTGGSDFLPPGGNYNYEGSSWTPIGTSVASRSGSSADSPAFSDGFIEAAPEALSATADRERFVQVLQPRSALAADAPAIRIPESARGWTADEARPLRGPQRPVEITDLPLADRLASAAPLQAGSGDSGVRLVSGIEGSNDSTGVVSATEFTLASNYGYDPDYRWLRGRLEYSQIDRRWKLRYIPVDGTTDDFGGSVVLPDPTILTGYERGEFVEVRGELGQKDPDSAYAPTYQVAQVARLGHPSP